MGRRTFIAAALPGAARDHVEGCARSLARRWKTGTVRWTPAASLHLTLRFLGDTPEERLVPLREMLDAQGAGASPMTVSLEGLGGFPDTHRPHVVWVGIRGDTTSLRQLQRQIELGVRDLGFEPERRAFRPHLTIGRPAKGAIPPARWDQRPPAPLTVTLDRIRLTESTLAPGGARYETLHEVDLS